MIISPGWDNNDNDSPYIVHLELYLKYAVKKSLHKCIRVLTDISVKQCVNIDIITAKKDVRFKKKKITYTYTTLALSEINEKLKLSQKKKT